VPEPEPEPEPEPVRTPDRHSHDSAEIPLDVAIWVEQQCLDAFCAQEAEAVDTE